MKYIKASKSYCWYSDDTHLYVFPFNRARTRMGRKVESGSTIKHRRKDGTWRHYTIRAMLRRENDVFIFHAEAVTHLSRNWRSERIPLTKRYIRFKVCI